MFFLVEVCDFFVVRKCVFCGKEVCFCGWRNVFLWLESVFFVVGGVCFLW